MSNIKFQKGEIISYGYSDDRKLGIVVSDPFFSHNEWQVKTYCDGSVYSNSIDAVEKICDEVEVIKPTN